MILTYTARHRLWNVVAVATLLAMLATMWLASTASASPATQPTIDSVSRITMNVEDLDRSTDFYTRVLSFAKDSENEVAGLAFEQMQGLFGARAKVAHLHLGDEKLDLVQYITASGREIPRDSKSNDRWFQHIAIITSDMDRAFAILRENRVRYASSEPQLLPSWNRNAAGIRAFYFRDPDSHTLEILQFPADKGAMKWHRSDHLFLGIDHTAIVVANTAASLAFYRDMLGMHIAGTSENFGIEQEHLNNVQGAHLRITTLRADKGPGVELLEYLAPSDGRPYPSNASCNDIFNWETVVASNQLFQLHQMASSQRCNVVSTGDASSPFIMRDPDGHAVQVQSTH